MSLGGEHQPTLDRLFHPRSIEGVDINTSLDEVFPGVGLDQARLSNIHAGALGLVQQAHGLAQRRVEPDEGGVDFLRRLPAAVALEVTVDAESLLARTHQEVAGGLDAVVAMTGEARSQLHHVPGLLVRALVEELLLEDVAGAADALH